MRWVFVSLASLLVGLSVGFYAGRRSQDNPGAGGIEPVALPARPKSTVEIKLSATIDGSDRFVFAGESLWNEHLQWQPPKNVVFNGEPWTDLTMAPPGWSDQARDLDLTRATIVNRKGRDVISLEPTADGFVLYFSDSPMGSAVYEAAIAIPRK
jgi:hypothetical protein